MSFDPWGLVSVLLIAVVVIGMQRALRRMDPKRGGQPRATVAELRAMTPVGKTALGVCGLALFATAVGRAIDPTPVWFWPAAVLVIISSIVGVVSERRRVRRANSE